MALAYNPLFIPQQLPITNLNLFVVTSEGLFRNGRIRISNTTALPVNVKAWDLPSGQAVGDAYVCIPLTSIPPNSFVDFDLPIMNSLDTLVIVASVATSLTACQIDGFLQF